MKLLSFFSLLLLIMVMISCDCMNHAIGYVRDAQTGQPVAGAHIDYGKGDYEIQTDSTGFFQINYLNSFCSPRVFKITKSGYADFKMKVNRHKKSVSYRVNKPKNNRDSRESNAFSIKNDTIYFYMNKKQ